jgi:hypothetical protein
MQKQTMADGKTSQKLSEFDRNAIQVLRCLVPDQEMRLNGCGDCGSWLSRCVQVDELAITTISKNGENIVKIVYDYDSSTEQEFWGVE